MQINRFTKQEIDKLMEKRDKKQKEYDEYISKMEDYNMLVFFISLDILHEQIAISKKIIKDAIAK